MRLARPARALLVLTGLAGTFAWAGEPGLPAGVTSVLQLRQLPAESLSVRVDDLDTGEVVLQWRDDEARNPASTIKLLTTLVALDLLGPAYRWKTEIYALGEQDGRRLAGDLLIKGYGDPFLVTERVWQMLRELRLAGIDEITGDLLLDDSWFDVGEHDPAAFDHRPLRAYNVAPNALLMNFKVVRFWFEPEGRLVKVTPDPMLDNLRIENRLSAVTGPCRGYQRGIAVSTDEEFRAVRFSGRFPAGCERYAMDRSPLSHNEYVYGLFTTLWREVGGYFDGDWRNEALGEEPGEALEPLLSFASQPLSETIARVNKYSNNVMARHLLYTLAAEVNGPPGTEAGGRDVVRQWLEDRKLPVTRLELDNGAGLSRKSRIAAADLAAMLRYAWSQPYMPEYLASLSLSGLDGTLRRRFNDSELVGTAHLKTGSLDHVAAIAGYLQSRSGRRFVVVALQNYEDVHRGTGGEVQEALLRWLYEH